MGGGSRNKQLQVVDDLQPGVNSEKTLLQEANDVERSEELQEVIEKVSLPAGRLKNFVSVWEGFCKDQVIIEWVKGYKIPFNQKVTQASPPIEPCWSATEQQLIAEQINKLLGKGAIRTCQDTPDQFMSKIFLIPKSDGSHRLILNLKNLNEFISTEHFKLEDIRRVRDLIKRFCFMATLDLKDAYYLVSIDEEYTKYLRFKFNGKTYEFTCLPFGLSTAPYVFTKILKPVFTLLRSRGLISVRYLDDIWLMGESKSDCLNNLKETIKLLRSLGFIINREKSQLTPSMECKFLGFKLDSVKMRVELPGPKKDTVKQLVKKYKKLRTCKIREFASFIGTLSSCCPAMQYAWVYLKDLEREKTRALEINDGNYEARMEVPASLKEDFCWWENNIEIAFNPIKLPEFCLEIFTDASLTGWGASCNKQSTHGFWSEVDRESPINHLELLAAFFGLKCFASEKTNCDILLRIDNTTAIAYINRMGGTQFERLSSTAKDIWRWCEARNIWIFASYIQSKENTIADRESRRLEPETEYELNEDAFRELCDKFGRPKIDLFASRINTKCRRYISWKKDPGALTADAFTVKWNSWFFYAFPPFTLIPKILGKVACEDARGILVVPNWPSQTWYPQCMKMFEPEPIIFNPNKNLLIASDRSPHPLWRQLSLVVGVLSNRHMQQEVFQQRH